MLVVAFAAEAFNRTGSSFKAAEIANLNRTKVEFGVAAALVIQSGKDTTPAPLQRERAQPTVAVTEAAAAKAPVASCSLFRNSFSLSLLYSMAMAPSAPRRRWCTAIGATGAMTPTQRRDPLLAADSGDVKDFQ